MSYTIHYRLTMLHQQITARSTGSIHLPSRAWTEMLKTTLSQLQWEVQDQNMVCTLIHLVRLLLTVIIFGQPAAVQTTILVIIVAITPPGHPGKLQAQTRLDPISIRISSI